MHNIFLLLHSSDKRRTSGRAFTTSIDKRRTAHSSEWQFYILFAEHCIELVVASSETKQLFLWQFIARYIYWYTWVEGELAFVCSMVLRGTAFDLFLSTSCNRARIWKKNRFVRNAAESAGRCDHNTVGMLSIDVKKMQNRSLFA